MINGEWALVFFTLITQMCVGAFIFQEILIPRKSHNLALLAMMIIAVLLSFFHLGKPGNAIHSLNNLGSSWLSREILMLSIFTILLAFTTIADRSNPGKTIFLRITSILTMIAGLTVVFSMPMIYMMKTIPVWNSMATLLEFLSCTVILGGMLILLLSGRMMQEENLFKRNQKIILVVILFLIADISNSAYSFMHYREFEMVQGWIPVSGIIKIVLHFIALLVLLFLFKSFMKNKKLANSWIIAMFTIILLSEIIGRHAFYASYMSPGV